MRAISVRQPWAWALVTDIKDSPVGNKTVENRSWPTSHRGDLLIVSSQKRALRPNALATLLEERTGRRPLDAERYMALGSILGVVEVVACLDIGTYERALTYAHDHDVAPMTIIQAVDSGRVSLDERTMRTGTWWSCGPYVHVYSNVRQLPVRRLLGRLGLWDIKTIDGTVAEEWVAEHGRFVR